MKKQRLDNMLVEKGLCATPEAAARLVYARQVKVGEEFAAGPAQLVAPDECVQVVGQERFVSRGGHKLQAALDGFGLDVVALRRIDVGCSTGGFSDCLLQAGAASVACVDVGYGDLAWKVRSDPRVTVFERTNIRVADPAELGAPFDCVVADLSFIGLARLAGVFAALCHEGSMLVALVKPQFESAHEETVDGLVVDPGVRLRTVAEVGSALEAVAFAVQGSMESPVAGKRAGNVEYLLYARFAG